MVTSTIFVRSWRLIARKLTVLFRFHCGIWPFYTACCFDELSRGFVSCLLNSFGKWFPECHNSFFNAKIDDHGVCWGDTGWILSQWRRPVVYRVARDLPYWVMCLALYRLIRMAIKMASEADSFFSVVNFMSRITVAKRPCYGLLKKNELQHCSLLCI